MQEELKALCQLCANEKAQQEREKKVKSLFFIHTLDNILKFIGSRSLREWEQDKEDAVEGNFNKEASDQEEGDSSQWLAPVKGTSHFYIISLCQSSRLSNSVACHRLFESHPTLNSISVWMHTTFGISFLSIVQLCNTALCSSMVIGHNKDNHKFKVISLPLNVTYIIIL